jgi:hypothetical protein
VPLVEPDPVPLVVPEPLVDPEPELVPVVLPLGPLKETVTAELATALVLESVP